MSEKGYASCPTASEVSRHHEGKIVRTDILIPCAAYHRERFLKAVPLWNEVAQSKLVGRILVVCQGWYPVEDQLGKVDALIDVPSDKWQPSVARNAGLSALESELVLYCDADVVMLPDTVRAHVYAHKGSEEPRLTANLHKDIATDAPLPFTVEELEALNVPDMWRSMRVDWRVAILEECRWLEYPPSVPLWSLGGGSGICLPREWAQAVGGWNEDFHGWGYEDAEFWYRCQKSGLKFEFIKQYAYHQQHEVDIPRRIADSQENSQMFTIERDSCKVTYIADAVTDDLAQLVLDSEYNAEVIGAFPLNMASPMGIRSVPAAADQPTEAFRAFARGWYLCDMRGDRPEPSSSDWHSLTHCGSHTVQLGGLDYIPKSSTGFVQHRVSGGAHNVEASSGPY